MLYPKGILKRFLVFLKNHTFGQRPHHDKLLRKLSLKIRNKKILEIGSGHPEWDVSYKNFFDESNQFIQTEIDKTSGHTILDITSDYYKEEVDVVLCLNVLEHLMEYNKACDNIHKSLKPGGMVIITVPFLYPIHDAPGDYLRYTEYCLKDMLKKFSKINIRHFGLRIIPFSYMAICTK